MKEIFSLFLNEDLSWTHGSWEAHSPQLSMSKTQRNPRMAQSNTHGGINRRRWEAFGSEPKEIPLAMCKRRSSNLPFLHPPRRVLRGPCPPRATSLRSAPEQFQPHKSKCTIFLDEQLHQQNDKETISKEKMWGGKKTAGTWGEKSSVVTSGAAFTRKKSNY